MTITRKILSPVLAPVLAASVALASLVPLASAATADEWRHHGNRNVYSQRVNPWAGGRANPDRYEYRHDGGYEHHRHRDHVGGAVAVGIFATVLGLALAAESNRVQHQYYDDSND
jgi:hypothetical protein